MLRKNCAWVIGLAFLVALATTHQNDAAAADEAGVNAASSEFYAALNAIFKGDMAPMEKIWSHADDVTYLPPSGTLLVGWSQVAASWKTQAQQEFGGEVEPTDVHVTVGEELAVTQGWEKGKNVGPDGKAELVSIRATNVFRKEDGTWKMIGHHTDLLPFMK